MGDITFVGWLSGFWCQTGSVANWRYAAFVRRLGEGAAPGGKGVGEGDCGPCPDFASYTLAFALQLRKITENLSQADRKALGWSALKEIRLVDLAIAGDLLDCPAGPCRPWLLRQAKGSTLGQRKYLPTCRTGGFPTSANFESKLAVRPLMGAWMSVCYECCVLSGRGLCDGLITRPEESYRLWCVWVWSWSLHNEETVANWGLLCHGKIL
jgi:hypothetical protein